MKYHGHPKFFEYLKVMAEIHSKKNWDYAKSTIDPFRNFRMSEDIGIPAWKGSLIRMGDKFIRINNIALKGNRAVKDETIIDTLIDLANYSIITAILYEEWKNK